MPVSSLSNATEASLCHNATFGEVKVTFDDGRERSLMVRIGGPHPQTKLLSRVEGQRLSWTGAFRLCEAGLYSLHAVLLMVGHEDLLPASACALHLDDSSVVVSQFEWRIGEPIHDRQLGCARGLWTWQRSSTITSTTTHVVAAQTALLQAVWDRADELHSDPIQACRVWHALSVVVRNEGTYVTPVCSTTTSRKSPDSQYVSLYSPLACGACSSIMHSAAFRKFELRRPLSPWRGRKCPEDAARKYNETLYSIEEVCCA